MKFFVDIAALLLIVFIVGWFWMYRPRATIAVTKATAEKAAGSNTTTANAPIEILVADGVYSPSEISLPAGRNTVLRFLRRDRSPCAETVVFDGLDVSATLPVDVAVDVTLHPEKPGRYDFTCQMRMYRGVLVVQDGK